MTNSPQYLSDVIPSEQRQFEKGKINLFTVKPGQGKTTAALGEIPSQLGIEPRDCLFLIDTKAGQFKATEVEGCQQFGAKLNKPTAMNYALFAKLLKQEQLDIGFYKYIACDEIHNLAKYARIEEAALFKEHPEYDRSTRSMILLREGSSYRAAKTLFDWAASEQVWVFGFSGTPSRLLEWREAENFINQIRIEAELVAYQILLEENEYGDISFYLAQNPPHKRLIGATTIQQVQKISEDIRTNTNRHVLELWSPANSNFPLDNYQKTQRDKLIIEGKVSPEIDDIVATIGAYGTGISIFDESFQETITHSSNKDDQEQFDGRLRFSHNYKRKYNNNLKQKEKDLEKKTIKNLEKKQALLEAEFEIPSEFLNRKLSKAERDLLVQKINFPKKWTSLKKWLLENNYNVKTDTHGLVWIEKISPPQ